MKSNGTISKRFNVALFFYLFFVGVVDYLFNPQSNLKVPWDNLFEWSPPMAISAALIVLLILLFVGAAIVKSFWSRFISDVFSVRDITYDESLAIVMLVAVVSI